MSININMISILFNLHRIKFMTLTIILIKVDILIEILIHIVETKDSISNITYTIFKVKVHFCTIKF